VTISKFIAKPFINKFQLPQTDQRDALRYAIHTEVDIQCDKTGNRRPCNCKVEVRSMWQSSRGKYSLLEIPELPFNTV